MNFNLDKILSEWAYRVDDGQPSVSNPDHLENLREILYNFGLPHKFIVEYVHGLTEADKVYFVGKPPKGAKVQQGPRGGTYYYGNSTFLNDSFNFIYYNGNGLSLYRGRSDIFQTV